MNAISTGLSVCRDAAGWGLRLYLRHFPLVFGLAIIPTVQRFVLVYWGSRFPFAVNVATEVITWVARVALVAVVITMAIARDPHLRPYSWNDRVNRAVAYVTARPLSYVVQLVVLGVAVVVFDVLPKLAVGAFVAAEDERIVDAVLIAVKNPVVITFTFIWLVGAARLMMLTGGDESQPLPDQTDLSRTGRICL